MLIVSLVLIVLVSCAKQVTQNAISYDKVFVINYVPHLIHYNLDKGTSNFVYSVFSNNLTYFRWSVGIKPLHIILNTQNVQSY